MRTLSCQDGEGLTKESASRAARCGETDNGTSEVVYDLLLGINEFVPDSLFVLTYGDQILVGERMALNIETGMIEDVAQLGAGVLQQLCHYPKRGRGLVFQMHVGARVPARNSRSRSPP